MNIQFAFVAVMREHLTLHVAHELGLNDVGRVLGRDPEVLAYVGFLTD